jgi:hypothetical protein
MELLKMENQSCPFAAGEYSSKYDITETYETVNYSETVKLN